MNDVITGLVLDTRRAKKDGTYPVKLRLTYQRKQKYYATKYSFTEDEFAKIMQLRPPKKYKEVQVKLQAIEARANKILEKMPAFSFNLFQEYFTDGKVKENINHQDVYAAIESYIDDLRKEGSAGTADIYSSGMRSLQAFQNKLLFADVTPNFLKKYENWMLNQRKSYSTIGIYTRQLRTIFNKAIDEGYVDRKIYPFGRRKYQTPTGRNIKKALVIEDIQKIFMYEPENESEEMYRDFWILSYLANGINVKDMIKLKYRDARDDKIVFLREKTKKSNRVKPKPIVVPLTEEISKIIEKWGNPDKAFNSYVFNYLSDGMSPERELAIKKQLVKQINKYIRRITKKLGIEKDVTTYVARHSFVTVLKRSGASMEFISESVGHSNLRTTEGYADSFEDKIKKHFAKALTDFSSGDNQ